MLGGPSRSGRSGKPSAAPQRSSGGMQREPSRSPRHVDIRGALLRHEADARPRRGILQAPEARTRRQSLPIRVGAGVAPERSWSARSLRGWPVRPICGGRGRLGRGIVDIRRVTVRRAGDATNEAAKTTARYLAKYVGKSTDSEKAVAGNHRYEVAQGFQPRSVQFFDRSPEAVIERASAEMLGRPTYVWH